MANTKVPVELSSTPGIVDNSNATAITIDSSENAAFTGTVTANAGVVVDNITIDGTEIDLSSGDLDIDVAGNIRLDADDAGEIRFLDGGTQYAAIKKDSNDAVVQSIVADGDLVLKGIDGSSVISALTLDMSDAGAAIFNNSIRIGQSTAANLFIGNNGDVVEIKAAKDGTDDVDLAFQTQATGGTQHERLIIKADGKVGLGTSTPDTDGYSFAEDFVIMAGTSADDGVGITLNSSSRRYGVIAFGDSADTNAGEIWYDHTLNTINLRTAAVHRFSLDSSGNGVFSGNVTAYGSPSDLKLKENIEVIENALDKVKQLKGITYDLKSDGNRLTGLIAQDLEKVLPEAVYTSQTLADGKEGEVAEEHLAIRYGNTVGLLVEAIKELEARVKELEAK